LYSIAWRYNLDYRKLAQANNLDTRYTIYPGQELRLDTSRVTVPAVSPKPASRATRTVSKAPEKAPPPPKERSIKATKSVTPKANPNPDFTPKNWSWPTQGKIIATFSSGNALHKGIDLVGDLGEPVVAA